MKPGEVGVADEEVGEDSSGAQAGDDEVGRAGATGDQREGYNYHDQLSHGILLFWRQCKTHGLDTLYHTCERACNSEGSAKPAQKTTWGVGAESKVRAWGRHPRYRTRDTSLTFQQVVAQ